MDLKNITVAALREMLDKKEISAPEAAAEFIAEIKEKDGKILDEVFEIFRMKNEDEFDFD